MRLVMSLLLLLGGCGNNGGTDPGVTLRGDYFEAVCRLYADPACVANAEETCGFSVSFDTQQDCRTFLSFAASGCTGYLDLLQANESTVRACIAQADGFDCEVDDVCTDDVDFLDTGSCGDVTSLIDAQCPEGAR